MEPVARLFDRGRAEVEQRREVRANFSVLQPVWVDRSGL
jgi:hypothetical protein